MNMSSYEVVSRAIEFEKPDRLPLHFEDLGLSDIHNLKWNQIGVGDVSLRETIDEWGCVWSRTEVKNIGQVRGHPLSEWKYLNTFLLPDPDDSSFYDGMEGRFQKSGSKYIRTNIFMLLFERMQALRGFENTLMDFYLEREQIELLADKIVEFDLGIIRNISQRFTGQIHGMMFTDDWGTQQNLMIKTQLWREFFKPRYKRIIDAIHEAGWHAWMHSCGRVNNIIGDLIEIGLDAINLQQPTVLGITEIGKRFQGKICFVSLCDIQHTLPFGTEEQIIEEANLLLNSWSTYKGGFILSDYGDGKAIGVDKNRKQIMLEAFLNADPWRRQ